MNSIHAKRSAIVLVALLLAGAIGAFGQSPTQVVGLNAGFCQACTPQINGGVYYGRAITNNEHPTYSFSLVNINKIQVDSWKPLKIQVLTSTETGIAQHICKFSSFDVYSFATAGLVTDSTNLGSSFSGGGMAIAPVGKGWFIGPYLRVSKPAIANTAWAVGITIGIGTK